ncbi:type II toxin-antitoxin system prevent-host-death family antitoxin [Rhodobacteraceae bacterium DSL-40]|uniref:type II toxin-antitoxin system Phd/YefM family antitoxin n=1 Tax=Amaricoccus sp. B4 TaxID=3368557 RepID=UPI000DABFA01
MKSVNMHEAKTNLSRLVEAAVEGEPFVIARAGHPLVRVAALAADPDTPRRIGFLEGRISLTPEFALARPGGGAGGPAR